MGLVEFEQSSTQSQDQNNNWNNQLGSVCSAPELHQDDLYQNRLRTRFGIDSCYEPTRTPPVKQVAETVLSAVPMFRCSRRNSQNKKALSRALVRHS